MTAFDLQLNPAHPSLQLHKLDKAKDPELLVRPREPRHPADRASDRGACCSATSITTTRPTRGPSAGSSRRIRRPAQRSWWSSRDACRRSSSRSMWRQSEPRAEAESCSTTSPMATLLGYGVPPEWLADVRATEEDLLVIAGSSARRGGRGAARTRHRHRPPCPSRWLRAPIRSSIRTPTSLPRDEECGGAGAGARISVGTLGVFLHPEQRKLVEQNFSGPARVSGSAGTGKTSWRCTARRIWPAPIRTRVSS